MTIQLRQICLVANKLEDVLPDLRGILGINSCYVDAGVGAFGLQNNLMAIGRNFLEVVAPIQPNTAGGRYLERRGGDGGYMVITHIDSKPEFDALRQRALDNGVRVAHEYSRDTWWGCQLHPGDLKAAFLEYEYDTHEDFSGHWMPVGGTGWEDKVRQDITVDMVGVELQGEDPQALADLWGSVTHLPVEDQDGHPTIAMNNARLRFVTANDGRGPGLGGLDIIVADREAVLREARLRGCYVSDQQVDICGTRWYLHDA